MVSLKSQTNKTKIMHYQTIKQLQKHYGYKDTQDGINSGEIWKGEGSSGRYAMDMLTNGYCMLPKVNTRDYYGNLIPSRDLVISGSKGTFQNCANFWQQVVDGEINIDE
jgi:hypothetical protein